MSHNSRTNNTSSATSLDSAAALSVSPASAPASAPALSSPASSFPSEAAVGEIAATSAHEALLEKLTAFYTSSAYEKQVVAAKDFFFDDAGVMDEENPSYEMRMTQFLEWYTFTRPLEKFEIPPAQRAIDDPDFPKTEEETELLKALAQVRHSLFEFQMIRAKDIYIRDLYTGKKIIVRDSQIRIGFRREELFDTRLLIQGDQYIFLKAFCFHPPEASSFIKEEVRKIQKSDPMLQEALMLRLMKMRYKYEQYRHLKLEDVYTNERRVRF